MRTNLHHLLEEAAGARPDAPALTFKDVTVTYGELWETCEAAAGGLAALGLRRGERVAVFLDKRVETVAAFFATSAAGAVFVPVNPVLKAAQVSYILGNCDVRVLVTSADRLAAVASELARLPGAGARGRRRGPGARAAGPRGRDPDPLGEAAGRRGRGRRAPARWTSTSRPSSTRRAARGGPRAWCSATAT